MSIQTYSLALLGSFAIIGASIPDANAQLINPSFELGLSGWSTDSNTYPGGDAGYPIGTDGNTIANLGTFDQPGSFISQAIHFDGGPNFVAFTLGANASSAGLTASVLLTIVDSNGNSIASQTFSVDSVGFPLGALGFEAKSLPFTVPGTGGNYTISFFDVSPNNGISVDVMIDAVQVQSGTPPPPPPPPSTFVNGGFEQGLSGWKVDPFTYPIGNIGQPIGSEGVGSANLGTFDQLGSAISQRIAPQPGLYALTFALGANGIAPGLPASISVDVVTDSGRTLSHGVFATDSLGYLSGPAGFVTKVLGFKLAPEDGPITVKFSDTSINGGAGIDVLLDDVRLTSGLPRPTDLTNASFENGLSGWNHDISTYPIGTLSQPIGTRGVSSANLGTFDQPGSFLSQTIVLPTGLNALEFDLGANGVRAGLTAAVKVTLTTSSGTELVSRVFKTRSLGFLNRRAGFEDEELVFRVPKNDTSVILTFSDVSPNGGIGVDVLIDDIRLSDDD